MAVQEITRKPQVSTKPRIAIMKRAFEADSGGLRKRFDDTCNWTVKWNMVVPGATSENSVDNRAWSVS